MTSVQARAWLGLVFVVVLMATLLFASAGTTDYWQAWVFLVVFAGISTVITIDMMKRDPALLERRVKGGPTAEHRAVEQVIMTGASAGFIALLVVPGLDHRFAWSHVPTAIVIVGDLLVVLGFYLIGLVYRENTFASATIEVAKDHRVIDTGPYAIVRHPMYASASFYLIGMSIGLGSYRGLLAFIGMMPFLIWRLIDEERMLVDGLPGYREYQGKVPYRLVPHIW